MKHFVLSFMLSLFCAYSYGQKVFYFYNFSPYDVEIGSIVTMPYDTTQTYPYCESILSSTILVSSGTGIYMLENSSDNYKFPFDSPNSTPYITNWERFLSSSSSSSITSSIAWALGSNQVFDYVKFQVGSSGSLGGGNLGVSYGTGQGDLIISPNGWTAEYSQFISGTYEEYTCVIY